VTLQQAKGAEPVKLSSTGSNTESDALYREIASYGAVEAMPLSRIQVLTGKRVAHNWATIPHVTHHDEADITELEALRSALASNGTTEGKRVTALSFCARAVTVALEALPKFNAALSTDGQTLILRKHYHVGIMVDTPKGLVVAVIRDCERKNVFDIASEIATLSAKARERGLPLAEMSGSSFSISSLGKLGGTAFSPIINAPEVAILGISRVQERPARAPDGGLEWRTVLPLSLSYDHRAINGADAARFCSTLRELLAKPKDLLDESFPTAADGPRPR
jgi:pyruvate dehydrogenase E2 component (dihydrolipoamide acetyltransferase)